MLDDDVLELTINREKNAKRKRKREATRREDNERAPTYQNQSTNI